MPNFTLNDIPDLTSKVFVVTGGNNGLGKETILQLSKHNPSKIFLCARSQSKAETAIDDICKTVTAARSKISFVKLDLSSFVSVKQAADTITASTDRLDVLINNAGIMAAPPGLTQEGYEIQFGTNHIGHALLIKYLTPLLVETARQSTTAEGLQTSEVRVVAVSSGSEMQAPCPGFVPEICTTTMDSYGTYIRYAQSKLANILYSKRLAKEYPQIKFVAIAPGRVRTELLTHMFENDAWTPRAVFQKTVDRFIIMPVEKGVVTQLWAATGPAHEVSSGAYYQVGGRQWMASKASKDMALAEKLWNWTEAEFTKHGY